MLKDPFIKGLENFSTVKCKLVSYLGNQIRESAKVILINKSQMLWFQTLGYVWQKLQT